MVCGGAHDVPDADGLLDDIEVGVKLIGVHRVQEDAGKLLVPLHQRPNNIVECLQALLLPMLLQCLVTGMQAKITTEVRNPQSEDR